MAKVDGRTEQVFFTKVSMIKFYKLSVLNNGNLFLPFWKLERPKMRVPALMKCNLEPAGCPPGACVYLHLSVLSRLSRFIGK